MKQMIGVDQLASTVGIWHSGWTKRSHCSIATVACTTRSLWLQNFEVWLCWWWSIPSKLCSPAMIKSHHCLQLLVIGVHNPLISMVFFYKNHWALAMAIPSTTTAIFGSPATRIRSVARRNQHKFTKGEKRLKKPWRDGNQSLNMRRGAGPSWAVC